MVMEEFDLKVEISISSLFLKYILPPFPCYWCKLNCMLNSPFSKIIFSSFIEPKKLSLVSLESHDSTLSNDTKLKFLGPMRPEKIIFKSDEFNMKFNMHQ